MTLKDLTVRTAKPQERAYKLTDGAGLYLYVSAAGGKSWRWDYRYGCKGKTMALGQYPHVPLAQTQERHAEGRRLLATGIDPMDKRKEGAFC